MNTKPTYIYRIWSRVPSIEIDWIQFCFQKFCVFNFGTLYSVDSNGIAKSAVKNHTENRCLDGRYVTISGNRIEFGKCLESFLKIH